MWRIKVEEDLSPLASRLCPIPSVEKATMWRFCGSKRRKFLGRELEFI